MNLGQDEIQGLKEKQMQIMRKEEEQRVIEEKREEFDRRNQRVEKVRERKEGHHIIFQNKK